MALDLVDYVFSWSLKDLRNHQFYKDKVKKIPKRFTSVEEYLASYTYPLIEETHAAVCSSMENLSPKAPKCRIVHVKRVERKTIERYLFYEIVVSKDGDTENGKEIYEPQVGDLMLLSNAKSFSISDLKRSRTPLLLALVTGNWNSIEIRSSNPIEFETGSSLKKGEQLYAVCLTNMTPSIRIWRALHPEMKLANMKLINSVLCTNSTVGVDCDDCLLSQDGSSSENSLLPHLRSFSLNESQTDAVVRSISKRSCYHKSSVKLIWGPPGTGKTKTVGTLLWVLLKLKCRTLTCTPTNIALLEVTSRLLKLARESFQHHIYGLGDIVLFGNKKTMKIEDHKDLHDVFLDYRVRKLANCCAPYSGWNHQLKSMISLLEDAGTVYLSYLEKKKKEMEKQVVPQEGKEVKSGKNPAQGCKQLNCLKPVDTCETMKDVLKIEEFIKKSFTDTQMGIKSLIPILCKHIPMSIISLRVREVMSKALDLLQYLGTLLHGSATDEQLKSVFVNSEGLKTTVKDSKNILLEKTKNECLEILKNLLEDFSLPDCTNKYFLENFCLKHAYLIFCTASSSAKLHTDGAAPLEILVIDEAAQLKECESAIPLQLPGVRHAILIGDERQLPAMIQSKISEKAEFGRSLFQRLVSLGHKKHLLNIQYRMHPSISQFPNTRFYEKQILDAANVKERSYERHFLQGNMYGPYSFINVSYGREQQDGCGKRNMVEVAVISEIVKSLFKASSASKQKLSVGVISPYKAQVFAIKEELGNTNSTPNEFSVSVRTVDGFQGGEEDIIIISTVRSNGKGSVGFLDNVQRTNVALTRARYCLWVLGNAPTLINSGSLWRKLVLDAKDRRCFYDADEDKCLKEAMISGLVELGEFENLLNIDSLLFSEAKWKVVLSNDFWKSVAKIRNETKKEVLALLKKLANGWRDPQKQKNLFLMDGTSSEMLEVYKVDGLLNLVWTVDILKENSKCIQILKVWDILPFQIIPKLAEQLDDVFGNYTVNDMNRCRFKYTEGKLEVPMSWEISSAAKLMDQHNPDQVQNLSSSFGSLHLERKSRAPAPVISARDCRTNCLTETTRKNQRSDARIPKCAKEDRLTRAKEVESALSSADENSLVSSISNMKKNVCMEEFEQVEDCCLGAQIHL